MKSSIHNKICCPKTILQAFSHHYPNQSFVGQSTLALSPSFYMSIIYRAMQLLLDIIARYYFVDKNFNFFSGYRAMFFLRSYLSMAFWLSLNIHQEFLHCFNQLSIRQFDVLGFSVCSPYIAEFYLKIYIGVEANRCVVGMPLEFI